MKRLVAFFCLLFLPTVTLAAPMSQQELYVRGSIYRSASDANKDMQGKDSCTENAKYKDEYKIDRRCYVEDKQKARFPYNAVVLITYGDEEWHGETGLCTGVIIKDADDGQLYVYTAGHCDKEAGNLDVYGDIIFGITQSGEVLRLKKITATYDKKFKSGQVLDFAIYAIPKEQQAGLPYTTIAKMTDKNLDIIGYGSLSILSDKAIHAAKQEWEAILSSVESDNEIETLKKIIPEDSIINLFPKDANLKGSFKCNLRSETSKMNNECQGWHGNSGGPYFNSNGQVVAIVSRGSTMFSTDHYAAFKQGSEQRLLSVKEYLQKQAQDAYNTKVLNDQMLKQIQQQDRMQLQDIRLQNQQMMMNMNKQYW